MFWFRLDAVQFILLYVPVCNMKCYDKVIIGVCLFSFSLHSFQTLLQFFSGSTTLITNFKKEETLKLPMITICNSSGFKNMERNIGFKDFLKNVVQPDDIFKYPLPDFRPIYGRYMGQCFLVDN